MRKVKSFTVDHRKLKPGIYASITNGAFTYDIRLIAPAKSDSCPSGEVLHTLEHFFASFLREKTPENFSDSVLYVGPMGCKTGFYLVTSTYWKEEDIRDILLDCCNEILCADKIPGATDVECGNWRYFNLHSTKDFVVDVIIPTFNSSPLEKDYPLLNN